MSKERTEEEIIEALRGMSEPTTTTTILSTLINDFSNKKEPDDYYEYDKTLEKYKDAWEAMEALGDGKKKNRE